MDLKVFFSLLDVCHKSEINDSGTMNSYSRTVFAHKQGNHMLVTKSVECMLKELLVLYKDRAYA